MVMQSAALGCAALTATAGSGLWGRKIPARPRERAFDLGGFGNALYSVLSYGPIQGPSGSQKCAQKLSFSVLGLGYL